MEALEELAQQFAEELCSQVEEPASDSTEVEEKVPEKPNKFDADDCRRNTNDDGIPIFLEGRA